MSHEKNSAGGPRNTNERRNSHRFPLQLAVAYRRIGSPPTSNWTASRSLNISSTGLLFAATDAPFTSGEAVEVFIEWPVRLDKLVPLKLVIKGCIVRNGETDAAIRFERYEFKTRHTAERVSEL